MGRATRSRSPSFSPGRRSSSREMRNRRRDRDSFRERERDRGRDRERDRDGGRPRDIDSRPRHRSSRFDRRSRSREQTEKKSKFYRYDSPPKDGPESAPGAAPSGFSSGFSGGPGPAPVSMSQLTMNPQQVAASSNSKLASIAAALGLDANAAKAARELYVGNLPPGVEVQQLVDFLNAAMVALKATIMPGNPVTKSWISTDGHYAFVEFRTMEEAANGMQLNGLMCMNHNLRIGRPKTYPPELAALVPAPTVAALDGSYLNQGIAGVQSGVAAADAAAAGEIKEECEGPAVANSAQEALKIAQAAAAAMQQDGSGVGADGSVPQPVPYRPPEKVCITGLPTSLSESKAKSLVETFGPVSQFQLLTTEQGESAGVALCLFEDSEAQQAATEILHENTPYRISPAEEAAKKGELSDLIRAEINRGRNTLLRPQVPTRILMLGNLVSRDDLIQDTDFDEIREDVKLECEEYGTVVGIEIPRPVAGFAREGEEDQSDVGFAFIEFSDIEGAARARSALSGRKFGGRVVQANYFSEVAFKAEKFKQAAPNFKRHHSSVHNAALLPANEAFTKEQAEELLLHEEEDEEREEKERDHAKTMASRSEELAERDAVEAVAREERRVKTEAGEAPPPPPPPGAPRNGASPSSPPPPPRREEAPLPPPDERW